MESKFEIILTLNFEHEYYTEKEFKEIELIPHAQTLIFFKNHRIIFKRLKSKYLLIQEGAIIDGNWQPTIEVSENKDFVFQFKINDPLFQAKTDIDFFANKTSKISIEIDESGQQFKLLPFSKGIIQYDNSDALESNMFCVQKADEIALFESKVQAGETELISPENPGVYHILRNNLRESEVVFSSHDAQYDGFIFLKYSSGVNQECKIIFNTRNINLRFAIKSKYIDFNPEDYDIELKEDEGQVEFHEVPELIDGFVHFSTKNPISLKDIMNLSFYLEIDGVKQFEGIGTPSLTDLYQDGNGVFLIKYLTI